MKAKYICPVLTAFSENGAVDMEAMKVIYDRLIQNGLDGIAILGSSGEFYAMDMEECKDFIEKSLAYINGRIPAYIGTGRMKIDETAELSNFALEKGATAVMVIAPYYIGMDKEGVFKYYDDLGKAVKGDIIIYNFPDRNGFDITSDIVIRLLENNDNYIGIKDTVAAASHTADLVVSIKKDYPEFNIFSGYDNNFVFTLLSGGDGCIAALSNIIPEVCVSWRDAFNNGNIALISKIQKEINEYMSFYAITTPFMPAMKYALGLLNIPIATESKLPATNPSENQQAIIKEFLQSKKLI